ncbi:MAG: glutathione synthase [Gammaproteobacteria bacterium]|jgi:glutathione synthase
MSVSVGVVMDPISDINPKKDTTLAILLGVQRRGWDIHYMELNDLGLRDGVPFAYTQTVTVKDSLEQWYEFTSDRQQIALADLDIVLMRKDPPFDTEYIFATYLLEQAQARGCVVVNDPRALRDANEKLFTAWFAEVCPSTLVTRDAAEIKRFLGEFGDIIIKPLDGMGGASIFRVTAGDSNASVIYETLTHHGKTFCMVQNYVPEIVDGDKRILMIDGEPIPYALARVPSVGELRGNLAAGGTGRGQPLTERDREICAIVGPELKRRGLIFVGLDVIGDYLTEINVTSPTCMRELESQFDIAIADQLVECIAGHLKR